MQNSYSKSGVLAVLGALLMFASGCSKPEEKEKEPVVPVRVTAAAKASIRRVILAQAILYPRDQAAVVPKVTAPVREFHVNRGDHVQKGQLLAELENRDLAAAEMEARGNLVQA